MPDGMATISFELDSEDAVQDCTVTIPSGAREFDELSCRLTRERGRYEPVRDEEGKAIPAALIHTLNFSFADDCQIAACQMDMPLQP